MLKKILEAVDIEKLEEPPKCIMDHLGFQAVSQLLGITGSMAAIQTTWHMREPNKYKVGI